MPSVEDDAVTLPPDDEGAVESARAAPACGWYGKISSLGDFASRRLPEPFVAQCDDWLSRGLAASRQQLGERWLDVYLTAPLWRFALAPGLAGDGWWLGALMPSVDRVGRYFPLLLASPCERPPQSAGELQATERFLDHVAGAALATLAPTASLDSFEAALQGAPAWQDSSARRPPPALSHSPHCDRYSIAGARPLAQWAADIGTLRLLDSLRERSLWWAPPIGDAAGAFSVASGWPPAERFRELLEGSW